MRICFLADADSANTQSWANHFGRQLGHDIHIITLHACEASLEGIQIHRAYRTRPGHKAFFPLSIPRIRSIIREINPSRRLPLEKATFAKRAVVTGNSEA